VEWEDLKMAQLIEIFQQLGYDAIFTEVLGIIYVNPRTAYIHYDHLQVFCKLVSFKGISIMDGQFLIEFVN
jgi:hypothetical protein